MNQPRNKQRSGHVKATRHTSLLLASVFALALTGGCGGKTESRPQKSDHAVSFNIKELNATREGGSERVQWLATRGKFKFRMELALKDTIGDQPFVSTEGAIFREQNSEQESMFFLLMVSAALGGESLSAPKNVGERVDSLPFGAVILGRNLSRGVVRGSQIAGAFSPEPPGDWIAVKVFVADGDGEFFLNLNRVSGEAEIAMKDADCVEVVTRELAKVLGR